MEITITKSCIYKDGRCHGVFSDNSALILHVGGQYISYFSPTGDLTRQVSVCTVGGLKSKVLRLVKQYNSSNLFPISLFSDEIYKTFKKDCKITSTIFLLPGLISVICNDQETRTIRFNPNNDSIGIIEQDSKGSMKYKSIDNETSITLNFNKILFKVSYKMLLPEKKPTWGEGQGNRIRLCYEYAQMSQIFHINNYPKEWEPILNLMFAASGQEFITPEHDEINVILPCPPKSEIWADDTISPAVNIFTYYKSPILCYWEPEGTFYVTSRTNSTVLIHEDSSILECNSDYFTHYRTENVSKFTSETVPVCVKSAKYTLHRMVSVCKEFQKIPTLPPKSSDCEDLDESLIDGVKCENEVEGLGNFIAYHDKSIRVLFNDRTLIRIYNDFTVSAISRNGETTKFALENPFGFEQYIPVCVEFYNWAFLTQTENNKRNQENIERENIVSAEISKYERLGNRQVLDKSKTNEIGENIQQNLIETQRKIEETKELLNKLKLRTKNG